jgi:hypothetical protein
MPDATLRRGQTFRAMGAVWRVQSVSQSRAHIVSKKIETVTLGTRTFRAHRTKELDISPRTDVRLLGEICP